MKIIKIKYENACQYFDYNAGKFRCHNPEAKRKNGNYRIINYKLARAGKFPKWCPLPDYKEADHETPD